MLRQRRVRPRPSTAPAAPVETAVLARVWTAEPRQPCAPEGLGIGVITFNRRETLRACLAAVEAHTRVPFHLVIADDGSQDGSASWARESGIPVVTGRNRGVAWNKNRALAYLMEHTACGPILLLEDDCHPCAAGWEDNWIRAAKRWGHVTYANAFVREAVRAGKGTPASPWRSDRVTGQCAITTREMLSAIGYLDTRFRGFGVGHVEWDDRCRRHLRQKRFPCMDSGLAMTDAGTFYDAASVRRNEALRRELRDQPFAYCPPARTEEDWADLRHELERCRCCL